jgi:hypothetical protein
MISTFSILLKAKASKAAILSQENARSKQGVHKIKKNNTQKKLIWAEFLI